MRISIEAYKNHTPPGVKFKADAIAKSLKVAGASTALASFPIVGVSLYILGTLVDIFQHFIET